MNEIISLVISYIQSESDYSGFVLGDSLYFAKYSGTQLAEIYEFKICDLGRDLGPDVMTQLAYDVHASYHKAIKKIREDKINSFIQ